MPPETAAPAKMRLQTTVNGRPVSLEIEPRAILLDVLRDDLGLTGAKRSCDTQVCGACTVLLDGEPVLACITPAWEAEHHRVTTIEGLAAPGRLERARCPLEERHAAHFQQRFRSRHAARPARGEDHTINEGRIVHHVSVHARSPLSQGAAARLHHCRGGR